MSSNFVERMKSDKRFRDLVDAYLDGRKIEALDAHGRWVVIEKAAFNLDTDRYRLVIVRDTIPIEAIDDRWKFYARDDGDDSFLYKERPEFCTDSGDWFSNGNAFAEASALKIKISECSSEESLIDLDELRREKGLLK